jgi:hypothetical protein
MMTLTNQARLRPMASTTMAKTIPNNQRMGETDAGPAAMVFPGVVLRLDVQDAERQAVDRQFGEQVRQ